MSTNDLVRAELHCHTSWSRDCLMRPDRLVQVCIEKGIEVLAITDHNEIGGAFEVASIAPFTVIVGEEIKTREGELIGYFLKRHIPKGLSAEDTAMEIKSQGGIVSVPHPFDSLRNSRLKTEVLERLITKNLVDIIEAFNSRTTKPEDNTKAEIYAASKGIPVVAGSDAHTYPEVGTGITLLSPFSNADEFLMSTRRAVLTEARLSPWPVHLASTWAKIAKKVKVL